jgi:hypothetical protein
MTRASSIFLGLLFLCLCSCRRATQEDCQVIIDKSVELQMKESNKDDPGLVAKEKERLAKEMEEAMGKNCVGRIMSKSAIDCVRGAQSTKQLEQCVK